MTRLTRRHFLMSSAAGALAATRLGAKDKVSPNEKLHVGVIGIAGQGAYSWGQLRGIPQAEIVALCDVHESRTGDARKAFPNATFDVDFRKMLDRKGIDAVVVATPDHMH